MMGKQIESLVLLYYGQK